MLNVIRLSVTTLRYIRVRLFLAVKRLSVRGTSIGGNAFIVNSVSEGMKVSVKNPELEYSVGNASMKDGYWDWCI